MLGRLLIVALLLGGPCASAYAQEACPPPPRGPIETTPISGSSGVAVNAIIRARYPVGHLETYPESIQLYDMKSPEAPLPGTLESAGGDTLFFVPDQDLLPGHDYVAIVSGVDRTIEAQFRTGPEADASPPSEPVIVQTEAGVASATCAQPDGGVRLSFVFETSTDDAGAASMQYTLFRTRGPELEAPSKIAYVPQEVASGETQTIGAVLSEREAAGVSCFVIVAEDGLLQTAASGEHCFEPGVGVIFDSLCSTSDPASAARGLAPTAFLLALALLRRRRRRSA